MSLWQPHDSLILLSVDSVLALRSHDAAVPEPTAPPAGELTHQLPVAWLHTPSAFTLKELLFIV